jgi:hypothetical protein
MQYPIEQNLEIWTSIVKEAVANEREAIAQMFEVGGECDDLFSCDFERHHGRRDTSEWVAKKIRSRAEA